MPLYSSDGDVYEDEMSHQLGLTDPKASRGSISITPTGVAPPSFNSMGELPRASDGPSGRLEEGNIDLTNRPKVYNEDGSVSTVRSMSSNIDGREVLMPTVSDDGRILNNDEAIEQYKTTGKHLGIFDTPDNATSYAEQLHNEQSELIRPITTPFERAAERTKRSVTAIREEGKMSKGLDMAGQDIMRMATTPKRLVDAIQRKYNPTGELSDSDSLPEDLAAEFSWDLLTAGLTSAPFKPGLGMFGGRMSKVAVKSAEMLERNKFSKHTIKEMTGLERGAEGMWRKEFSDADAIVDITKMGPALPDGSRITALDKILKHDTLYKIYPEARNIPIVEKNLGPGALGQYDSNYNIINLNSRITDNELRKAVLIHELQHWIQKKEGFSIGNTSAITKETAEQIKRDYINSRLTEKGKSDVLRDNATLPKGSEARDIASYDASKILDEADMQPYLRQSYEVEAFNTENRIKMTPRQIQKTLATDTEDFPRNKQIVFDPKNFNKYETGSTYLNPQDEFEYDPDHYRAQDTPVPYLMEIGKRISPDAWERFIKEAHKPLGGITYQDEQQNVAKTLSEAESRFEAAKLMNAPDDILRQFENKYLDALEDYLEYELKPYDKMKYDYNKPVTPAQEKELERMFPGIQKFFVDNKERADKEVRKYNEKLTKK